jgi:cobalt/nickel transport system permease protein
MHIPNGFIPLWQCAIYYVILFVALYFSLKWARKNLDEKLVPLMAVLAAGIFAIMSMNIPIPFGTSGHMVGGAMVAIIFCAPEAAVIIFTLVLLVQALIFGDGGITVLGTNVLNMGIIGGFVGLYGFKALRNPLGKKLAIGVAAWGAIFLSAVAAAVELWLAGTFPLGQGIFYMGLYHAFIGVIEAILTVVVIMALESVRPDLLAWNRKKKMGDLESEKIEVAAK